MKFVRFVGRSCTDPAYQAPVTARTIGVVDRFTNRPNVSFAFQRDKKPLSVHLSSIHRDFVDFATLLYVADEVNSRKSASDRWTRDFEVLFPVSDPSRWAAVEARLTEALSFLSGDRYTFAWPQRGALPATTSHQLHLPSTRFDVVCLFSGGLDSLVGAYELLRGGQRVLLVGHKSDGTASKVQRELAADLNKIFPGQSTLVQCLAAISRRTSTSFPLLNSEENTHRVRSFLFLSLAVSLASAKKVDQIVIPENGLIAINAPLQVSRRGTLSTRTAHPIFLARFVSLLSEMGLFSGVLKNPFLTESKTDLAARITPELRPLALASVSCAHPGRNAGYRNCGYCVPCLYRRAALIEVSIDQVARYRHDVFRELDALSARKQQDFRALVAFAERLESASSGDLVMMVLAHGVFPPEVAGNIGPETFTTYAPWTQMLKCWSESFLSIVRRLSSKRTLKILGMKLTRPARSAG